MLEQLVPSRRDFDGSDIIFQMHAAAQQRAAAGFPVINATIGALMSDDGKIVIHESVMEQYRQLTPAEIAPYAPIAGDPAYLLALTQRHWPDLTGYGVGVATPGGSGALALSLKNLLEPGQRLLTAAPYWSPYATLALENKVTLDTVPYPASGQPLDVAAWRTTCESILRDQGRLVLWLNDPCHNPTGRSLTTADRRAMLAMLKDVSALGAVTLLLDLAYLDYARDPEQVREAMTDYQAVGQEGRLLVGACLSLSKAFTLYGARAGALVFPWCTEPALQSALAISCRGTYSNCARAPMSVLLRMSRDANGLSKLAGEHATWRTVLTERANALDSALRAEGLPGATWYGGFFVTLDADDGFAMAERLKEDGVFVVPMLRGLRVGICAMRASDAPRFAAAYAAAVAAELAVTR
jgi:aspartate/tyrosine/aromatic aminotransferase